MGTSSRNMIWVIRVRMPHEPPMAMFFFKQKKTAQFFCDRIYPAIKRLFGPGSMLLLAQEKLLDDDDVREWFQKAPATENSVAQASGKKGTTRRLRSGRSDGSSSAQADRS